MPKRVIDGEGIWRSDKLARVEPKWVRAEVANLIPLSLANGVFEANPRRIWSQVYAFNRSDVTMSDVEETVLPALKRAGILFTWSEGDGKLWGYWIGIEKSGRLPSKSRLYKKHETVGPNPPPEELRSFINSMKSDQPEASQRLTLGKHGSGSGPGTGNGSGNGEHHPKNRDDVISSPKSFSDKAKKTLSEKYPDGEEKIRFGLQVISERAHNSRSTPRSEAYFLTAYENLREDERFGEEFQWYKENPQSNDSRAAVNALIRLAEKESKRTGREFLDCFHDLRQDPHAFDRTAEQSESVQ